MTRVRARTERQAATPESASGDEMLGDFANGLKVRSSLRALLLRRGRSANKGVRLQHRSGTSPGVSLPSGTRHSIARKQRQVPVQLAREPARSRGSASSVARQRLATRIANGSVGSTGSASSPEC